MRIDVPQSWELPAGSITPERAYLDRRRFIGLLGLAGAGLLTAAGASVHGALARDEDDAYAGAPGFDLYPAPRNARFAVERPLTNEREAGRYCNFYEFTSSKDVFRFVDDYRPYPFTVEVAGLCDHPQVWDLDALVRQFGVEERVYRHRCVEAWSMVVPWTGFEFRKLIAASAPRSNATHVRLTSLLRPKEMPGQEMMHWYKWPYYEGLRLDEAMNELAFFTTGIYGHPLPKQHGAPWRLVLPWKYGYKGPKAIVKIEFVDKQPRTFWNDLHALEYGFHSNVNPTRPHPRWSQASERVLDTGERISTKLYNGYEAQVAALYPRTDPE